MFIKQKLGRLKTMVPLLTCSFQMVCIILLDLYMCQRCRGIWFKM
ncbi:hypothetical protein M8C21_007346 [Ambrosia artemisiifolia]|uniref:Uncharacterized protein n=1 Tax=Ambrosia artemisiifolia TaxID=4212 RepID=A0AAD5GE36_AMBAR|nr:hypothetical protein M8C21_007346 [Ambrosia artemisiifolia]